jgi:hypothetical protein
MAVNRLRQGRLRAALSGFLGAARLDPTLGEVARDNVARVLTVATRRATFVATLMGLVINLVGVQLDRAEPSLGARVFLAATVVAVLAFSGLFVRRVPVRTWRSAMRLRPFLAVRAIHLVVAAAAGVIVALGVAPPGITEMAGPVVYLSGLVIIVIGRLGDG